MKSSSKMAVMLLVAAAFSLSSTLFAVDAFANTNKYRHDILPYNYKREQVYLNRTAPRTIDDFPVAGD